MLTNLIKMVNDKTISIKQGKEVLYKALDEKKDPTVIVKESGMKQIIDVDAIKNWVMEVLDEMPEAITQYKNGKTNIIDYLVGQVMKKSRGQANQL